MKSSPHPSSASFMSVDDIVDDDLESFMDDFVKDLDDADLETDELLDDSILDQLDQQTDKQKIEEIASPTTKKQSNAPVVAKTNGKSTRSRGKESGAS